jgi:hypothetical protein
MAIQDCTTSRNSYSRGKPDPSLARSHDSSATASASLCTDVHGTLAAVAHFLVDERYRSLLQERLRSLEAVPVYGQLPYFGFECLSGNAQLNGGADWTANHAVGFAESASRISLSCSTRSAISGVVVATSLEDTCVSQSHLQRKSPLQTESPPARLHFVTRGCCPANRMRGRVSIVFLSMLRIFLPNFLA